MASREQQSAYPAGHFPMPGDRVLAFDHRLYRDDVSTPLSVTVRPATVVARYGKESERFGRYPDLVDLSFDHRPGRPSRAHFTDGVRRLTARRPTAEGIAP